MEEFISFPYFIVIVCKRSLVPFVSLVLGSLRLTPIKKIVNFKRRIGILKKVTKQGEESVANSQSL